MMEMAKAMALYSLEIELFIIESQLKLLSGDASKDTMERVRQFMKFNAAHTQSFMNASRSEMEGSFVAFWLKSYADLLRDALHRAKTSTSTHSTNTGETHEPVGTR